MAVAARPTLHIIAGPNGAGKTTLYETRIKGFTAGADFVNADLLALGRYGHPARTVKQSEEGQRLAEARRHQLMARRMSLVTESTFSHPSKLDLVRHARSVGYRIVLYHVNIADPELAVRRVEARVAEGGHPVPDQRIRDRYARNQALIREAVLLADRAFVFDNSALDEPARRLLSFEQGRIAKRSDPLPQWAANLYADDLARRA